jgi:hypothetical protein
MYTITVRLVDGDFLAITQHDTLDEALQVAADLDAQWKHEYHVIDAAGRECHRPPKTSQP